MSDQTVDTLKSVEDILGMGYTLYIPSYQRGYRWTQEEVKQLLDDLAGQTEGEPYFLQLLAVREDAKNKRLRIIDGQQRLTTCLLILKCCSVENLPEIRYETRDKSALDCFFLKNAKEAISKYFKDGSKKEQVKSKLLSAKFLYYSVLNETEEMPLFHRLNMWKIPAEDAELVKCIMLAGNDKDVCVRAYQWDEIERRLNDDVFFAFISRSGFEETSLRFGEFLKIVLTDELLKAESIEKFPLFACVNKKNIDKENLWQSILKGYHQLVSWYDNPFAYHILGWNLHRRGSDVKRLSLSGLDAAIGQAQCCGATPLDNLQFGLNDDGVRNYLFLANVAFCACGYSPRYRFDLHQKCNPRSIEHIHARNQHMLNKNQFEELFVKKVESNKADQVQKYYDEYEATWKTDGLKAEENLYQKCKEWKIDYRYPDGNVDNEIKNLAVLQNRARA